MVENTVKPPAEMQGRRRGMRTTIRRLGGCCMASLLSIASFAATITDSPLVEAVKQRNTAVVRTLLNQHIDVNGTQPDGTTALAWAAQRDDLEIADLLIRAGAKVNDLSSSLE